MVIVARPTVIIPVLGANSISLFGSKSVSSWPVFVTLTEVYVKLAQQPVLVPPLPRLASGSVVVRVPISVAREKTQGLPSAPSAPLQAVASAM